MKRSIPFGSLLGVRIYIHWTFLLLIIWSLVSSAIMGLGLVASLWNLGFLFALFGCVVLHELGHASAARLYGIPTRDITLLPIGGVARLERMPRKPLQEIVVALAGPLVNVVIATVLFSLLALLGSVSAPLTGTISLTGFLSQLAWLNVGLILFNMIPAFPLDGGRVFRAGIALFTGYARATRIAAATGQIFAIGLALLGLFVVGNPILLIIAVFLFLAAGGEAQGTLMLESFRGYRLRDGMASQFEVLPRSSSLRGLATELLSSAQPVFPVWDELSNDIVGIVYRRDLIAAARGGNLDLEVGDLMKEQYQVGGVEDPIIDHLEQGNGSPILVFDNDRLVGLFLLEQAMELIEIRKMLKEHSSQPFFGAYQSSNWKTQQESSYQS